MSAINNGDTNGLGDIRRGEDEDVGEGFDAVELREEGVDDADRVRRFGARQRGLACRAQALYLICSSATKYTWILFNVETPSALSFM